MHDIARMFDRYYFSIMPTIYQTGEYRPPDRKRHPQSLWLDEWEEISHCLVSNQSIREIARRLSRAPSTISREIKRNGGLKCYRAVNAEQRAWDEALRPKPCKLIGSPELCKLIAVKLKRAWSPQQIAGWLKRQYLDDQEMYVCHETIYKTLFIQARGALKKELRRCLRTKRAVQKSRTSTLQGRGLGQHPRCFINQWTPCIRWR